MSVKPEGLLYDPDWPVDGNDVTQGDVDLAIEVVEDFDSRGFVMAHGSLRIAAYRVRAETAARADERVKVLAELYTLCDEDAGNHYVVGLVDLRAFIARLTK